MKRRAFLAFAAAAALRPYMARAQSNLPLVGFLNSASAATYRFNADSFREGLARGGFVENQNVRIEERWANADYQALPRLAAELVAKGVVAIAATGDVASARAAQAASSNVPVVFTIGGDPVRFGLVASLRKPGGHVTGISLLSNVLGAKRVELLREIAPTTARIALLMNPNNPSADTEQMDAEAGARKLGCETVILNARNESELMAAFTEFRRIKADSFITATDPILLDRRQQLIDFAAGDRLPAVYFTRQFAVAGGLISYGPSISWMYREAGNYIAQILKGAKPADMPVMQPTQFEFVLNLSTARKLALDIPAAHMALADELID